ADYNAKVAELQKANDKIKSLSAILAEVHIKAKQSDNLVNELEGEVKKANAEVANHGKAVEAVKEEVKAAQPSNVDEIDTNLVEVQK
ncbi:hypothetical protein CON36_31990, partial [Bacillus cereus]